MINTDITPTFINSDQHQNNQNATMAAGRHTWRH